MRPEGLVIGVVGESSLETQELLTLLEGGKVPLAEVIRMGPSASWGSPEELAEFHENPALEPLPPLDSERLAPADAVVLGRTGPEVRDAVLDAASRDGRWVLDMEDCGGPWVDPDGDIEALRARGVHLRLPDPGAMLASLVGRTLSSSCPLTYAAHRFLPASTYGEAGVRDLHAQGANLLRFHPIPPGVLPGQVAFNITPTEDPTGGESWCEQVECLWPDAPAGTSASFLASTFHGAGLSLALSLGGEVPAACARLRAAFADHALLRPAGPAPTPVEAASSDRALIACRSAGSWLWVWVVYDNVKVGKPAMAAKILATLAGQ